MRTISLGLATLLLSAVISNGENKEPFKHPVTGDDLIEVEPSPLAKAVNEAGDKHFKAMAVVNAAYRKDLAAALGAATEIEIYLLDFASGPVEETRYEWEFKLPADEFPIVPYKQSSKILQRKKLTAEEVKRLMPSLQETIRAEGAPAGALCHYPIHGIRIRDGENILFQTSICYMCGNFYMAYPLIDGANWEGLSGKEFEKVMKELLPIPEKETNRFKKEVTGEEKK